MKRYLRNAKNALKIVGTHTPKKYFAVMIYELLVENAKQLLGIIVPALIVDCISSKGSINQLLFWAGLYAGITVLTDILRKSISLFSTAYWYRAANLSTFDICKKGMQLNCADLDSPQILDEYNCAIRSPWEFLCIDELVIKRLVGTILTIIEMLWILSKVHIIVMISVFLLSFLYANIHWRKVKTLHDKEQNIKNIERRLTYPLQLLQDYTYGKEIRIYNMCPLAVSRYRRLNQQRIQLTYTSDQYVTKIDILLKLIDTSKFILVYSAAVYQYMFNALSLGSFAMYYRTLQALSDSLSALFQICADIRHCSLYYEDYEKFINRTVDESGDMKVAKNGSFEFQHVNFMYPGSNTKILDDVCFSVNRGEHIAIVGDNGVGKSTLVKLLTRLYEPTSGQIKMDGIDIRNISKESYFNLFAPVFQDFELYSISVGDNIAFLQAEADNIGVWRALENSGSADFIRSLPFSLNTAVSKMLDEQGVNFSGGESQRLAIARAYYKNASILILDEPTAALDPIAEEEIYQYIHRMTKEKTTIYISHRISTTRHADRILVVGQGRILEFGTFEQLMKNRGPYYEMFQMQAAPYKD